VSWISYICRSDPPAVIYAAVTNFSLFGHMRKRQKGAAFQSF